MSVRSDHRTALQTILQTISYNGSNITVSPYYITTADNYPYFHIVAGGLTPNIGSSTVNTSNLSYKRGYTYYISAVFTAPNDDSEDIEIMVDDIEGLVVDKLQSGATRDSGNWFDLVVRDVSDPYPKDPKIGDNSLVKTFEIQIITNINNP
jgi:hypothetical protein